MTGPYRLLSLSVVLVGALLAACDNGPPHIRFELLEAERTGITFANTITTSEEHDFLSDAFIYNGAGVGVGDVDGDGLPDIYLAGNMVSSRLYLNRGEMRFEDVTEAAGVGTDRWATGVSMVDIEGDGDLDIYVSVSGPEWTTPEERANLLFVNDGRGGFSEQAKRMGIADTGFTTHAVFFDYDRDGDLDLYLLANSPGEFGRGETGQFGFGLETANPAGFDQLYRNQGDGTFVNVSEEAGIVRRLGYGLGVAAADINRDGWTDLYISNDIAPNDVLYVNNGDRTFTDRAKEWLDHTSFAGMGLDIADFTNDGWPDIMQTDMMPEPLRDRKLVSGATTRGSLETMELQGFYPQYNTNTLQLSRGVDRHGRMVFSEIGRLAGVAYTDWSWTALFADLDNDGLKDLFITNGYPKAVTDFDYQANNRMARRMSNERTARRTMREMMDSLGGYRLSNYGFHNEGDLTFSDRTRAWGLDQPGYSYGAACADLDGDGWLDLVVNNIDGSASIYRNVGGERTEGHFLRVRLVGEGANARGIGARVTLTTGRGEQFVDHTPYRGFMSSVEDVIHFGVDAADEVRSLEVAWPDGRWQRLAELPVDTVITVRQADAGWGGREKVHAPAVPTRRFEPLDSLSGLVFDHRDNHSRFDFAQQPLLPHEVSRQGPPLAVADVDGDGLEDLFVGGGAGQAGQLFLQREGGKFESSPHPQPWAADSGSVDWGAHFFDADGDGLLDLYVASGGFHLPEGSRPLQDRLYRNLGGGRFTAAEGALPEMRTSTAAVRSADFNGDGRLDLFVAGRITPGAYPTPTRSYLLRNDGGRFTDVTAEVASHLIDPGGMISDAQWIDFDGDQDPDLVTAGVWMPIQFHRNDGGHFREVTEEMGLPASRGWWYRLASGDVDGDGDMDLVAGNVGLNHSYTTSVESPFGLYFGDLDGSGRPELLFTQEIDGEEYPYYGLALLGREMEILAVRYLTHRSFAEQSMRDIFGEKRLETALHYQADTFASVWLRNEGDGTFSMHAFPTSAQISPLQGILMEDLDLDGNLDLLVAGNILHTEPNTPPLDAGKGLWLRGDGRGGYQPVSPTRSGFLAPHDARDIAVIETPSGAVVVVANSGGELQAFRVRR